MPSLICPGAVYKPQPGGVTLDTSLPPRAVWHITWDALKADGTQPAFSAVSNYLMNMQYCPNIMWNPFTGEIWQFYPANVGGRALKYNNQDGAVCIQIEVFFTPGCVVNGKKYMTVADTPLKGWETIVQWASDWGVPRIWPMGAPQWANNPRTIAVWNTRAGHYGHCNSPGDTHTDPGPMPSLAKPTPPVVPPIPQEVDMPLIIGKLTTDDKVWIGNGMWRRHIKTPAILASYVWYAQNGWMEIKDNGKVQALYSPEALEALGVVVDG